MINITKRDVHRHILQLIQTLAFLLHHSVHTQYSANYPRELKFYQVERWRKALTLHIRLHYIRSKQIHCNHETIFIAIGKLTNRWVTWSPATQESH